MARKQPPKRSEKQATTVIAVGNQKGGVGKTTTAVNLAAALGTMGNRSLIIDLDANCGATRSFGIPSESYLGIFEVMLGEEDPVSVALESDTEEGIELPEGVSLITANRNLEIVDSELIKKHRLSDYRDCLRKPIETLRASGRWDYIFLDTAPNIHTPTAAAYRVAEWFILTATPDRLAIDGLNDAMSDIDTVRQYNNPDLKLLGVVLSRVSRNTKLAGEVISWVEEAFKDAGIYGDFRTRISSTTEVPMAQRDGLTILQTKPSHKVALEYKKLAREFLKRLKQSTQPVKKPSKSKKAA
jgi:chromosome partitioning protein